MMGQTRLDEPGVRNPAQAQGAATFRQALDMRDSHPAEKLDRTCDCRGYDAPRTGLTVPRTFDCKSGRYAQGMLGDDRAEVFPHRWCSRSALLTMLPR
jgi:hypothetical protein